MENINLYSPWIDCGFKNFETIDKEELNCLLKGLSKRVPKYDWYLVNYWCNGRKKLYLLGYLL